MLDMVQWTRVPLSKCDDLYSNPKITYKNSGIAQYNCNTGKVVGMGGHCRETRVSLVLANQPTEETASSKFSERLYYNGISLTTIETD